MKKAFFSIIAFSLLLNGCALSKLPQQNNNINEAPANNSSSASAEPTITPALTIDKNKLDLSNQQLKKVPNQIFNQTNLEELNLSNNQLTGALPAEIRHLQNLKTLNASNNLMTGVPAEIGQLQNLQTLNLSNNQLTGLPYELGNLKNLKTLNISGNNYSTLDLSIIKQKLPATVKIIK